LAAAVAEMAFAGGVGADLTQVAAIAPGAPEEVRLFAESTTRFVIEVPPEKVTALREWFGEDVPLWAVGSTVKESRLRIAGASGEWLVWLPLSDLKQAWQQPLQW
jgi:phosphoribosylformylglycinamidine synthase